MIGLVTGILQVPGGEGGMPEPGVRLSIWFIGMFLLAVGGALVWLRLRETSNDTERSDVPGPGS